MSLRVLSTSQIGGCERNEDFVASTTVRKGQHRFAVLLACDGVGGRPNGDRCAHDVGKLLMRQVTSYLRKRRTAKTFGWADQASLRRRLLRLRIPQGDPASACAFALTVVAPDSVWVFWAGDTRAYVLDREGELMQLTSDLVDAEGRLHTYFRGDGRLIGELGAACVSGRRTPLVSVATDGVHGGCSESELRHFLLYCLATMIPNGDVLGDRLGGFLDGNVGDNYSMAVAYRGVSASALERMGRSLLTS